MHLSELECSNYRSYPNDTIFKFENGSNVVIGENNAGKSNFIRAIEVVLTKLQNHTQIINSQFILNDDGTIRYEIPPEGPLFSIEEYHNKDSNLEVKIRMKLFLTSNDLVHLVKLKKTLEQSLGNRPPHSNELDGLKKGVKGIELTFRIGYDVDTNTHRTKESSMVLSFADEIQSKQDQKVQIDKYVKDQFDFSTSLLFFQNIDPNQVKGVIQTY